ncbi:MAG: DNA-deoxyinosine glycosylase [Planctomycetota bacterium]|nr:MAG: DNA-deoxyinosine glycosylase [Planctomycetota bacterium]
MRVEGFPPIEAPGARLLILGSMPSPASLAAGQYYGHPRNAFWWIMGELFGAGPELPYQERCRRLTAAGVAVWDSLRACVRPGSLDQAIEPASEVANDFAALFERQPGIRRILFNGARAEQAFRRHSLPALARLPRPPVMRRLPSTSPAMAALRREEKLARWRAALD